MSERTERFSPKDSGTEQHQASQRLLQDSGAWSGPSTKFDGKPREQQPKEGSYRALHPEAGIKPGTDGSYKNDEQLKKYLTPEAHKAALDSLVHIHTPMTDGKAHVDVKGSGTIIGHGKDVTYVGTVNHNTSDYGDDKSNRNDKGQPIRREGPIKVEMPNGKQYEARRAVLKGENGTDRSVLVVHTGDDTGSFKEAPVADAPLKGPGFAVGFPQDSKSPYVSPIVGKGDQPHTPAEVKMGARKVMTSNYGHTEEGMSGGGMYTRDGKLFSMDESNDRTHSVFDGVPIRRNDVERWKKELPTSW